MEITRHGEKRLRKRLGINKKAVDKEFSKVLEFGRPHNEFKGAFKKYLDWKGMNHASAPIIYNGVIYFIKGQKLVTAWPVPAKFRKYLKNQ